jgi:predicted nucleotidyltransferase
MVDPITLYPEIDRFLGQFLEELRTVLGACLLGLYLHGSLAYGGFDPVTSDIDFLVVTQQQLTGADFASLQEMHTRLRSGHSAWAQKLEGAYLPKESLHRHDPAHPPIPWLGVDGHFAMEKLGSDWIIQRWILREKGLAVAGPPLMGLIDPVSTQDLRQAVSLNLQEWWSPPFPHSERFQSGEYQAYAILTMCRSLYVLEHGRVASKPEATRWAMETLGEPWHSLVAEAAAWRPGKEFHRMDETVELIRFTLKKWGLPAGGITVLSS